MLYNVATAHGLLAFSFALSGSLIFRFSLCLSRGCYIPSLSLSWSLLDWLPALHHGLQALGLRNDIDGPRSSSIDLGGIDTGTDKQDEVNHGNDIGDDSGSVRNAPLMAELVPGSDNIGVVGVVSARIDVVVEGGVVSVRARVAVVAVVVVVPRALEPGAEEGGQDDGDEEDDEGEGDVGAGVDAAFEFADGAGDELGAAPEGGDDALCF